MFQKNEQVSHPGLGACKVTDICDLDLTGQSVLYYKLVPFHGASGTVYVPVDNAEKVGLRAMISEEQANTLMNSLQDADEEWMSDALAKQRRYKALFNENTIENLFDSLSAMSAIIKRKREKELGSVDKSMLESIQNKVLSEVAMALNISLSDAIQQAENLILQPQ